MTRRDEIFGIHSIRAGNYPRAGGRLLRIMPSARAWDYPIQVLIKLFSLLAMMKPMWSVAQRQSTGTQ